MPGMQQLIIQSDRERRVIDVWRANGRREGTIHLYLSWVRRFEEARPESSHLTLAVAEEFAAQYALRRGIHRVNTVRAARVALRAWSRGLGRCGERVPEWSASPPCPELRPVLLEFRDFRLRHAGIAHSTVRSDLRAVSEFLDVVLPGYGGAGRLELTLREVDDYVTAASSRWSRKTIARFCTSLRVFLRFAHLQGYLEQALAASVAAPVVRFGEHPPRALAWKDVQRLLGAIDVSRRTGRRDYAVLLMMATYGMGSAEVLHLRLEDLDWRAGTIRAFRPKTQVEYHLPLLPAVAHALLAYLQDGRPGRTATRRLFVAAVEPHGPMTSSAVRHAIRTYARAAGLAPGPRGGHALRHSHARRQVELGAPLKTVGDILGHRDPASTSAYVRVAIPQLRSVALPVPAR
jgi:integrase/recombinase XerD